MSSTFLKYDLRDESEQIYLAKFNAIAAGHGIAIHYATDRAALDMGLHLTTPNNEKVKGVTGSRVWFQFKGQSEKTLPLEKFEALETISQQVEVQHLRQWAGYGEAVYLVVYLEAPDKFFAIDIQRLIADRWGDRIFRDETFLKKDGNFQPSVVVHLPKATSEVGEAFWEKLREHRSMRIDISSFQGKPLPHTQDFQSKILKTLEPALFDDVVGQLLVAHRFRLSGIAENLSLIYPGGNTGGDRVNLVIGKLFEPFQYDHYLTREILEDEDGFREDGQQFRAHGATAVIVHSDVRSRPDVDGIKELALLLVENDIKHILVFVNHYMTSAAEWGDRKAFNCFPEFNAGLAGTGFNCMPIHLEDLGKSILLSPNVYLTFREDLVWLDDEVNKKIESGEYRELTEDEYFGELQKGGTMNDLE